MPERSSTATDLANRCRMFASSFAPLFALLALRFTPLGLRLAFGLLSGLSFLDTLWLVIVVPRQVGPSPYRVQSVEDRGDQVAGYLATYLLPFLVLPVPTVTDLIAYGLFLFIVGVVTVRSRLTHINPTMYLFGYRLVNVTTEEGFEGDAVVHSDLTNTHVLRAVHLDRGVLVEVRQ